jgi:hypothetical protein
LNTELVERSSPGFGAEPHPTSRFQGSGKKVKTVSKRINETKAATFDSVFDLLYDKFVH